MVSLMETEVVGKLILAAVLGALVGLERELHKKPAGLRTHALVCMGSALFTITSLSFTGAAVDASRIAAGIVTGIGFLGAGMIFKAENKIKGLTTAAELWTLAAIGLAVGIGLYFAAIAAAIIVLLILVPLKAVELETEQLNKKKR